VGARKRDDEDTDPQGLAVEDRERLQEIIGVILDAVAHESGRDRACISLETERVVTRAVFEAHRVGLRQRKRSGSGAIDVAKKGDDE